MKKRDGSTQQIHVGCFQKIGGSLKMDGFIREFSLLELMIFGGSFPYFL